LGTCNYEYLKYFMFEKRRQLVKSEPSPQNVAELQKINELIEREFLNVEPSEPIIISDSDTISDVIFKAGKTVAQSIKQLNDNYQLTEKARTAIDKTRTTMGKTKETIVASHPWKKFTHDLGQVRDVVVRNLQEAEVLETLNDLMSELKNEIHEEISENEPSISPEEQPDTIQFMATVEQEPSSTTNPGLEQGFPESSSTETKETILNTSNPIPRESIPDSTLESKIDPPDTNAEEEFEVKYKELMEEIGEAEEDGFVV